MQLHLLAIVGNGIGVVLISTLADEVTIVVVAAEERDKMREDFVLQGSGVGSGLQLTLQLLVFRIALRRCAKRCCLLFYLLHAGTYGSRIASTSTFQHRLDLRQEFALQEILYVLTFLVHDAVDAEVEFGMIHHEYLFQLFYKAVVIVFCHVLYVFI